MRQILLAMLATTALFGVSESVRGEVRYNIVPISPFVGSINPVAINDNGVVAGRADIGGGPRAFYFDGTLHILPTLGGTLQAGATGINNNGVIVGSSFITNNNYIEAFMYDGTIHDLGNFGGNGGGASGINNSGIIVGSAFSANPSTSRGFVYNGSLQVFGDPFTAPFAISDNGLITGRYQTPIGDNGFFYDGTMHDLGPSVTGRAVNSLGQAAGAIGQHAFYYDGTVHDLGTLSGTHSQAFGINEQSQVVGSSDAQGTNGSHAFLYDIVHGMVDLNSLIAPSSGWVLQSATAINERGEIVGFGTRTVFDPTIPGDHFYDSQGFILVPTPEPSTLVLAAFGFAGLAAWAWRRKRD